LAGNPERKLGKHKRRCKNGVKILVYLKEIDGEAVDSIHVAGERDQLR
jgi:uncharacterized protein (UPF0276 family)